VGTPFFYTPTVGSKKIALPSEVSKMGKESCDFVVYLKKPGSRGCGAEVGSRRRRGKNPEWWIL
jgi:hypothetical protein